MKKVILPVEIRPLAEGGFLAVCEAIQGCHAEGGTIAEALENLEDAAKNLLELRKTDGLSLPPGMDEYVPGAPVRAQVLVSLPE